MYDAAYKERRLSLVRMRRFLCLMIKYTPERVARQSKE
jgi:hypothetical protein